MQNNCSILLFGKIQLHWKSNTEYCAWATVIQWATNVCILSWKKTDTVIMAAAICSSISHLQITFMNVMLFFFHPCSISTLTPVLSTSQIRGFQQSITRIKKNYLNVVCWWSMFTSLYIFAPNYIMQWRVCVQIRFLGPQILLSHLSNN